MIYFHYIIIKIADSYLKTFQKNRHFVSIGPYHFTALSQSTVKVMHIKWGYGLVYSQYLPETMCAWIRMCNFNILKEYVCGLKGLKLSALSC